MCKILKNTIIILPTFAYYASSAAEVILLQNGLIFTKNTSNVPTSSGLAVRGVGNGKLRVGNF